MSLAYAMAGLKSSRSAFSEPYFLQRSAALIFPKWDHQPADNPGNAPCMWFRSHLIEAMGREYCRRNGRRSGDTRDCESKSRTHNSQRFPRGGLAAGQNNASKAFCLLALAHGALLILTRDIHPTKHGALCVMNTQADIDTDIGRSICRAYPSFVSSHTSVCWG